MAHKFDHEAVDPYAACIPAIESTMYSSREGYAAGAQEGIYSELSNAIVTALGDIAFKAERLGVTDAKQKQRLGQAVSKVAESIIAAYVGEADPEPAIEAIESDPRLPSLPDIARDKLKREIEKTRQLENLVLNTMRLPDLVEYAASLGLHADDSALEAGADIVEESRGSSTS